MSEQDPTRIPDMLRTPGTVIELGDLRRLHEFEDYVATQVDPRMTKLEVESWEGREQIASSFRPPKFNGTIGNVLLEVMDDPVARFFDARERGHRLHGLGPNADKVRRDVETIERWHRTGLGFTLLADASSSRKKDMGQIRAELWYMPVPLTHHSGRHNYKASSSYGGRSINRWVTKPVYDTERFVQLQEEAQHIGFITLRNAMQRAVRTPIHM